MIQRIQSVFLFLVAVSGIIIFFFPISSYLSDTFYYKFFLCSVRDFAPDPFEEMIVQKVAFPKLFNLALSILQLIIILLAVITIFRYKNRHAQIKMNYLNIFLNVILIGGIFFFTSEIENILGVSSDYGPGVVFPLLSLIFIFLANNYIKKDEKLIRSADRLR